VAVPSSAGSKRRIFWLYVCILICFALLVGRLIWVQVIQGSRFSDLAVGTRTRGVKVEAKRGDIVDRNGKVLAVSIVTDSVYAIPREITDPQATANTLSDILSIPADEILKRITRQQFHVYVQHKIAPAQSEQIRAEKLSGIGLEPRSQRFYPMNNRASHVLGFAGTDNQGLYGLEVVYENYLKGENGSISAEYDARNREIPGAKHIFTPPKAGYTLHLTVDETIQYMLERELEKAVVEHKVKQGTAIVMDTRTGGILAMASYPDYNPNTPFDVPASRWRNPAVSDLYEPGSTFKIVTLAAALAENKVSLTEKFNCTGRLEIPGATIRCTRAHGSQTLLQGVENSCNAVFVTIGQRLGAETFYEYIRAFSFGSKTGIDYPGEAAGLIINESRLRQVDLARIAFGQSISVTPLQMVAAAAAVANEGVYITPHFVDRVIDGEGNIVETWQDHSVSRAVISAEDSATIRRMLESVVVNGTGRNAYVPGYRAAGKTGTAQKVIDGAYAENKFVASFLGFAPANDPRLAMIVVMDEPGGSMYYGGQIAAPVFKTVIHEALQYLGVMPDSNDLEGKEGEVATAVSVPDLTGRNVTEAEARLERAGLKISIQGTGGKVIRQFPEPGEQAPADTRVRVFTNVNADETVRVPDIREMTMRSCAEILEMYGLKLVPSGSGTAYSQDPAPGTKADKNTAVHVNFQ
jgi:stage V sporulation protein D (sporulation-specific penicillin-binding protein)